MSKIGVSDKPKVIDLTKKIGTAETLTEARITCTTDEKVVVPKTPPQNMTGITGNSVKDTSYV